MHVGTRGRRRGRLARLRWLPRLSHLSRLRWPRCRWPVRAAVAGGRRTVHVIAATRGERRTRQCSDDQESWIFHFRLVPLIKRIIRRRRCSDAPPGLPPCAARRRLVPPIGAAQTSACEFPVPAATAAGAGVLPTESPPHPALPSRGLTVP
ncbi:hypothetical protein BURCENBC7_AP1367 [Burkholderia cenocepacia BC7]|nr:hypothetical protein BURCENK562V_C7425 [Burkholderia cenocepacia K56-2Valvano]ERI27131.1 hypothetical protein BURCENBC7_AP1367 [Burkholderia cenocepacia BC7]